MSSCDNHSLTERSYQTYWQDNNLCVVMKRPTVGVIELGKTDWNGVELDDVVESIYNECIQTERSGNAIVWVRFENPQTDKYGNLTMTYDDFEIATIPLSEARKYKSGKFLNNEYALTDKIYKVAFGNVGVKNHDSHYYNEFDAELENLRNTYVAPTDTLDF